MMNKEWNKLYESMLRAMEACGDLGPHTMAGIECCFNLAQKYWSLIQSGMENYLFRSKKEEIDFYKTVKPHFKSQIEYYNLLYQAEIFKPRDEPEAMKDFWIREQQKLERFIRDNAAFYSYHKNGATDRDEEFFLSGVPENESGRSVYTDDLIATLMALERYYLYAEHEISLL
jgi:hypothetical protein